MSESTEFPDISTTSGIKSSWNQMNMLMSCIVVMQSHAVPCTGPWTRRQPPPIPARIAIKLRSTSNLTGMAWICRPGIISHPRLIVRELLRILTEFIVRKEKSGKLRPAHQVARRNARERRRVQTVNAVTIICVSQDD